MKVAHILRSSYSFRARDCTAHCNEYVHQSIRYSGSVLSTCYIHFYPPPQPSMANKAFTPQHPNTNNQRQQISYSRSITITPRSLLNKQIPTPTNYYYTCTICWREFDRPCYTVGAESRIVCLDCWKWIFAISICWTCGEVVCRKSDAVSFGWCWWHWGCFSCLVCSVSSPSDTKSSATNVPGAIASSSLSRFSGQS